MTQSLKGITVIETATVFAGPMAGRLLADWGANVIHAEHPVRGDIVRSQRTGRGVGRVIHSDIDYVSENFNRNKRGITLDLSQEEGQEVMHRLLQKADVFIANFRARELKKFKLEYETLKQLNPRLICANVSGYGKRGPDKDLPGYEHTGYFSRSGMLHVLRVPGSHPPQVPLGLGDNIAGLIMALGIMTALFTREKTGAGQQVDVSLFQSGVFALSYDIAGSLVTGQDRQQGERKDVGNALLNSYLTRDGRWLRLGIAQPDPYWPKFCQVIGREDIEHDPRFSSFDVRINNHEALFHILEEVFLTKTLDEWKNIFNGTGLPWSPVQNLPEVASDPQARANGFFETFNHPTYGRIELVRNPINLSDVEAVTRMPAPQFSQHTEEVLQEYGYTWEDIARLKEKRVIA